jgi:putative DNA primase/helicase
MQIVPPPGQPDKAGSPITVFEQARALFMAGISIIPIRLDGTKAPDGHLLPVVDDPVKGRCSTWDPFKERLPAEDELRLWYDRPDPRGIATIGGKVSGNLEQLDFDTDAEVIFPRFCELVEAESLGLIVKLNITRTPREPVGYHARYRCREVTIPGNTKLASDPSRPPKERTLIETRGEGGYAVAPGSPPQCHHLGRLYEHHSGPALPDVQDITAAEREILMRVARSFDREVKEERTARKQGGGSELSVGDNYDTNGPDWGDLLQPHGWEVYKQFGTVTYWRRPGKETPGLSATTGYCKGQGGADLLHVFSSNADPFEQDKSYGKFRAYALLNHNGDLSAAAHELARQGFGDQHHHRNGQASSAAPTGSGNAPRAEDQPAREPWPEPVPLGEVPVASDFPVDIFPAVLGQFVREAALAFPCPPDYVAVPLLVMASAAIGASRALKVKEGHVQRAALYAAVVGPPGSAKTPAMDLVVEPAHEEEDRLQKEWEKEMKQYEIDRKAYEAAVNNKKKGTPNAASSNSK